MEGWFLERFLGKTLDTLVVVKNETDTEVQAISGATISSRAVNKGVRAGVEALVSKRGEGLDEMPIPEDNPGPPVQVERSATE
jgi:major membrane immunogen (membrane-anchored lipoprotein)